MSINTVLTENQKKAQIEKQKAKDPKMEDAQENLDNRNGDHGHNNGDGNRKNPELDNRREYRSVVGNQGSEGEP